MKKNGFILIETIIVLVVVIVSMLGLYKAYSFVLGNLKQNKYYDNINDVYKTNILKKLFFYNYPTSNYEKIMKADCDNFMSEDCTAIYDSFGIDYVIYSGIKIYTLLESSTNLSNTDVNYMKYLQDNYKYLIIHYQKDGKDYYASLEVEGL